MRHTAFEPSLKYSTDTMLLFWQPPSNLSPLSPSSFVVDDVSHCCAEQYVMAEKSSRFQDHRAVELIMPSPDPITHQRIGQGVRNFDSIVGNRKRQIAVISGAYAILT